MHKKSMISFVLAALLILLLPAAGMLLSLDVPAYRSDPPASGEGSLSERAESYIERNIGFRSLMLTLYGRLNGLLDMTGSGQVVQGRGGFLFYSGTMDDYYGRNQLTDDEVEHIAGMLAVIRDRLSVTGTRFIFLCAPNKNSVYPQYMPWYALPGEGNGNLTRLAKALARLEVEAIDALGILKHEKGTVYHRTDSHWNALGALLVYRVLMATVSAVGYDDYAGREFSESIPSGGDLSLLYMPAVKPVEIDAGLLLIKNWSSDRPIRSMEDMRISTRSPANSLSMLVLRDSFGAALFPYLANNTGDLTYSRSYGGIIAQAEGKDVVVLEIAERNLRDFLNIIL